MPNHTPGPWSRNIKPASRYPTIFAGRNTHVCSVSRADDETMEANLSLILAAPDMLEAARRVFCWDTELAAMPMACEFFRDLSALRDAIAKATGQ